MTKLHKTTTALLLSAVILLGGCAERGTAPAPGADTNTSSDVSDGNSSESSIDSGIDSYADTNISSDIPDSISVEPENLTSYDNSESLTNPKIDPDIDNFPIENITMPDGSAVNKCEANRAETDYLDFDFSFIRYAQPIYYSTFDDSDLINWETRDFKNNVDTMHIENKKYFKVKTGDKLENGLTVKTAKYRVYKTGTVSISDIEFDGELTLPGILYCSPKPGYNVYKGDLWLLVDPREFGFLPVAASDGEDRPEIWVANDAKLAIVSDKTFLRVGNINEIPTDLSKIISLGKYAKVKATIKNLSVSWSDNGASNYSTLVSAEPIT